MDTTPEYIKMSDCEEVQSHSKCQVGYADLMDLWGHEEINIDGYRKGKLKIDHYGNLFIHGWWRGKSNHLWLPYQHQIQEMLKRMDPRVQINIAPLLDTLPFCDTWEKFWLAYYMYEKHQKTWTGTEWIKQK